MRKIFQYKFDDRCKAEDFLLHSGYRYHGRRGFIRVFDRYIGMQATSNPSAEASGSERIDIEKFEIRLFANGYLSIFVPFSSPLLGISHIPTPVYTKNSHFRQSESMVID